MNVDLTNNLRRARRQAPGAVAAALLTLSGVFAPVGIGGAPPAADLPVVVATVGMVGDVAAELAGECAEVRVLIGPGSDPHLYRPTAGDVRALASADLVLYAGLHLEAGLGEVISGIGRRAAVVAVAETAVPVDRLIAAREGLYDPHVWMDPTLWALTIPVVEAALTDLLGSDARCVQAVGEAARALESDLAEAHAWARSAFQTLPPERRILVTAHDAFAYFGRAYEVEVEGVQGLSTESEASVADVRRVAELVVARRVPTVFVESTINPRTLTAVREAVMARGGQVEIGPPLLADALGDHGTFEGTYVGMVVNNVTAVVEGLGGTVPPLPSAIEERRLR